MAAIEWHLDNWVKFMRKNRLTIGYPSRSLGMETGGSAGGEEFDHIADREENKAAAEFDCCIESLEAARRNAIHHKYLGSKFRFEDFEKNLFCALIDLKRIAKKRCIFIDI
jgi:hypothetical protein